MTMTSRSTSPPSEAAALAERSGLTPIGRQPALTDYLRSLWERRHFIVTFARSRIQAENAESRLGQLWQVLNPLLNAAVYYLVFGVILGASGTIENYVAFLITGIFIFTFTQRTIQSGSKSISGNLGLVRALHFPRAVLPLAKVAEELLKMGTSLVVLGIIVLLTGEPLTWQWLLLAPAIGLQLLFSAGMALIFARLTVSTRDVAQFLPFALRIWLYLSGVMYSVNEFAARFAQAHPNWEWLTYLLKLNPMTIYIELAREALLQSQDVPTWTWYAGIGWAVVVVVGGFLFFWRAESRYGRG